MTVTCKLYKGTHRPRSEALERWEKAEPEVPHLDLLHLLLIGGVHLLQGLLQLLVPLQ